MGAYSHFNDRDDAGEGWSAERRSEAIRAMLVTVSHYIWSMADPSKIDEAWGDGELDVLFVYRKVRMRIRVTGQWGCHEAFEFRVCSEYDFHVTVVKQPYFVDEVCERVREAAERLADMDRGR